MNAETSTKWQLNIVIALLLVLLAVSGFQTWSVRRPAPSWEYKIVAITDESFAGEIDKLGGQGWELVTARRASTVRGGEEFTYEMIFKRPANERKNKEVISK